MPKLKNVTPTRITLGPGDLARTGPEPWLPTGVSWSIAPDEEKTIFEDDYQHSRGLQAAVLAGTLTILNATEPVDDGRIGARDINPQTGTSYTFGLADGSDGGASPLVTMDNVAAITATVPLNATVAFPVGTQIEVVQLGAGQVTFAPEGVVTIASKGGLLAI